METCYTGQQVRPLKYCPRWIRFLTTCEMVTTIICRRGNVTGPWRKLRGKWQELCEQTDEYTGLNEDELCQRLGFSRLLKSREISSSKLISNDIFTVVRLGNGEEIRLKNHRPKRVNPNLKEACTSWNLLCAE